MFSLVSVILFMEEGSLSHDRLGQVGAEVPLLSTTSQEGLDGKDCSGRSLPAKPRLGRGPYPSPQTGGRETGRTVVDMPWNIDGRLSCLRLFIHSVLKALMLY